MNVHSRQRSGLKMCRPQLREEQRVEVGAVADGLRRQQFAVFLLESRRPIHDDVARWLRRRWMMSIHVHPHGQPQTSEHHIDPNDDLAQNGAAAR